MKEGLEPKEIEKELEEEVLPEEEKEQELNKMPPPPSPPRQAPSPTAGARSAIHILLHLCASRDRPPPSSGPRSSAPGWDSISSDRFHRRPPGRSCLSRRGRSLSLP